MWDEIHGSDFSRTSIRALLLKAFLCKTSTPFQIRQIRKKMIDIIAREISSADLKDVVNKLIPDSMSMDITKACQGIYPLHDVHIRKVKVLRRPRFDLTKLMELHGEGSGKATTTTTDPTTGEVVERPEGYEPPVQEAV